ncbi:MAG: hypothetical protein HC901_02415 [Bdellovibrionaceae bacterium]|nr:hypothetical protein [Pseudobdellovibrionaceae bacterium]
MTPAREQELLAEIARLRTELERSLLENQLPREKINLMLARLFDKSSETVDPSQPELPFDPDAAKKPPPPCPHPPPPPSPPGVEFPHAWRKPAKAWATRGLTGIRNKILPLRVLSVLRG